MVRYQAHFTFIDDNNDIVTQVKAEIRTTSAVVIGVFQTTSTSRTVVRVVEKADAMDEVIAWGVSIIVAISVPTVLVAEIVAHILRWPASTATDFIGPCFALRVQAAQYVMH